MEDVPASGLRKNTHQDHLEGSFQPPVTMCISDTLPGGANGAGPGPPAVPRGRDGKGRILLWIPEEPQQDCPACNCRRQAPVRLKTERGIGQACPKHLNTWTPILLDFNLKGHF